MRIRTGCVIGLLVMAASPLPLAQGNVLGFSESAIKRNATARTMPEYPASSVASAKSGVAVAGLVTNPAGSVTDVTILEAPDQATGAAVREALMQWRFGPVTVQGRSEPYGLRPRGHCRDTRQARVGVEKLAHSGEEDGVVVRDEYRGASLYRGHVRPFRLDAEEW